MITKKHLLEWTTSEEAEKQAKSSLVSYYNQMAVNILAGFISIGLGLFKLNLFGVLVGVLWVSTPFVMWYISREIEQITAVEQLDEDERQYVLEIGKKTWDF